MCAQPYFPHRVFGGEELTEPWYLGHLVKMGEPSLCASVPEGVEVYRFLYAPTWTQTEVVRIEKSERGIYLIAKTLGGAGGFRPGTIEQIEVREVSIDEWQEFEDLLVQASFWTLQRSIAGLLYEDGNHWMLEGVSNNRYHSVNRDTPDVNNFTNACAFLMKLAEIDSWQ